MLTCKCEMVCPDVPEEDINEGDFIEEIQCFYAWNQTLIDYITDCHTPTQKTSEYTLWIIAMIGWFLLFLRELLQARKAWWEYCKSKENWLEVLSFGLTN